MDWQRSGLIGAILVVLYLLLLQWNDFVTQRDEAIANANKSAQQLATSDLTNHEILDQSQELPDQTELAQSAPIAVTPAQAGRSTLVSVSTDVLEVVIDTRGGDLVKLSLPEHLVALKDNADFFTLLTRTTDKTYIAQSGLIGANGTDTRDGRPLFSAAANKYTLADDQQELTVDLHFQQGDVTIIKQFHFTRGDYLIDVSYRVINNSQHNWRAGLFAQIKRDSHVPGHSEGLGIKPFLGAALTTEKENFKKLDFDDIADKDFKTTITGGWIAMVQHYFISAWIPDQSQTNHFSLRKLGNQDMYVLGFTSPQMEAKPGETIELKAHFYAGPKDQYRLAAISPYLDLTVDYGWLWWIAKPIFWVLLQLHTLLGNWGWAIIVLTLLIKLIFFKLSATSYRSMAKMRKLQPEMLRIRELYGNDRQKMSQETMNLYKKEKVNPMGGCLPILVQMPVFIALYWVLLESVELRHAPWIFWIKDLSVKDPFFVLPLLMGISMFIQQKLNPAPPDPMQAKVMQFMPIAFTVFFMFFPAGLVLYWTVNNVLSIAQQWVITRKIEAE